MCDFRKVAVFAVVAGIAVTALTALVPNTGAIGEFPDVRFVSIPMLGVSYWGSPLPWLKQVVYPGAPKQLIWPNLLADIVFWVVVLAVVKLLWVKVLAKPGKPKGAKAKRKPRRRRR
jgi:hypothetical protein